MQVLIRQVYLLCICSSVVEQRTFNPFVVGPNPIRYTLLIIFIAKLIKTKNTPYVRVVEGAVLKTVGSQELAGSNPVYGVYAAMAE